MVGTAIWMNAGLRWSTVAPLVMLNVGPTEPPFKPPLKIERFASPEPMSSVPSMLIAASPDMVMSPSSQKIWSFNTRLRSVRDRGATPNMLVVPEPTPSTVSVPAPLRSPPFQSKKMSTSSVDATSSTPPMTES